MDLTAFLKKNSLYSLSFFDQFFLERNQKGILFWTFLPFILLLNNLGVSFLNPCLLTKFLPFFATFSLCIIYRFKLIGFFAVLGAFCCCFLLSFSQLKMEGGLWHLTFCFSLILTFFIAFLSFEEVCTHIKVVHINEKELSQKLSQRDADFQMAQKTFEDMEVELKKEIERLKQESQLRHIEKIQDAKHLLLVQSEIELLTNQKNIFVDATRQAEEKAILQTQLLNDYQKQSQELFDQHAKELANLKQSRDELEKELLDLNEKAKEERITYHQILQELETKFAQEHAEATREIAFKQNYAEEIKLQFICEQKQAHAKINQLEECLILEKSQCEQQKAALLEQMDYSKDVLLEKQLLEEHYSMLLQQQKQELVNLQEHLLALQQQPTSLMEEEYKQLQRKYALLESSTHQLRLQFNEKSQILSQTRQELFAMETKLLVFEKEKVFTTLNSSPHESYLEKEIAQLCEELEQVEHEVALLEELYKCENFTSGMGD